MLFVLQTWMMAIMWIAEEMCNITFLYNKNRFNLADHETVKDWAKPYLDTRISKTW